MELRGHRRANKPQSGLFSRHYINGPVLTGPFHFSPSKSVEPRSSNRGSTLFIDILFSTAPV